MTDDMAFERVLLTNDDGIDAPGLAVLERVAAQIAREVWVVAPEHDRSGVSHALSLHAPLRVTERGTRRFAVSGTPGDCVVMGLRRLLPRAAPPQLVLSGVNRGGNLGIETVFSGTVGAAMTGMLLGVASIALSQAFSDRSRVPWTTAETLAPGLIRTLARLDWSPGACLNVNFPACLPSEAGPPMLTRQGAGLLDGAEVATRTDPRHLDYHWLELRRDLKPDQPGSETAALAERRIAVTPLRFERTDEACFERLARDFEGLHNRGTG